MQIRKYNPKDRERIRHICHATATDKTFIENKDLVCALYAEYYCDYEPDNVFVLANDNDEAVGYILCAENYKQYIKNFKKYKLNDIKKLSKPHYRLQKLSFIMDRINGKKYPAHLHIDILPEAQRGGWGTKLVDTLINHLQQKGVKGVCLGVGADNEMGINFYKKYGFHQVRKIGNAAIIYGLEIPQLQ